MFYIVFNVFLITLPPKQSTVFSPLPLFLRKAYTISDKGLDI